MFGLFAKQRGLAIVVAIAFLIVAAALAIIYFVSPRATIRITTGPEGGQAHRFIGAFIKVAELQHPRIRFEPVTVSSLTDSAKALEQHKADLAIIRSDVPLPADARDLVSAPRRGRRDRTAP